MTDPKTGTLDSSRGNDPSGRVPVFSFATGYIARICGMPILDYFIDPEKCLEAQLRAMDLHGWDDTPGFGWADWGGGVFGGEVHFPSAYEEAAPRTCAFPVDSPRKVHEAKAAAPLDTPMFSLQARFNAAAHGKGYPAKLRAGSVTALVCAAVGLERFLLWVKREPEALGVLYEKSADFLIRAARMMVRRFGPDLGAGISAPVDSLIGPEDFVRFTAPFQSRVNRALMDLGVRKIFLHLCGDHRHLLAHWSLLPWPEKIVVSADDRTDLKEVASTFGNRHMVAGNVSTSTIAFGTYQDVFDASFRCIEKWADLPAGFALMPACDLPVLAPPVNVHAMVAAARWCAKNR